MYAHIQRCFHSLRTLLYFHSEEKIKCTVSLPSLTQLLTGDSCNPSCPTHVGKLIAVLRMVDNNNWRVLKWPSNIPVQGPQLVCVCVCVGGCECVCMCVCVYQPINVYKQVGWFLDGRFVTTNQQLQVGETTGYNYMSENANYTIYTTCMYIISSLGDNVYT